MTGPDFDEMFCVQKYRCLVCNDLLDVNATDSQRRVELDHNHAMIGHRTDDGTVCERCTGPRCCPAAWRSLTHGACNFLLSGRSSESDYTAAQWSARLEYLAMFSTP